MRVLVADDDDSVILALEFLLQREKIGCTVARSPAEVLALVESAKEPFDVLLLDLNYERDTTSGAEGFTLLDTLKAKWPALPIVVMTGWASIDGAVLAMRRGAVDYVPKPWDNARLVALLRSAAPAPIVREERSGGGREDGPAARTSERSSVAFRSTAMKEILTTIEQIAFSDVSVLVTGEHGTGKEIIARRIHDQSGRRGAFVAVNAGALPEGTFESELFGHVRGAFTDAKSDREGAFARAQDGTIFLDEIGNMPPAQQAKLLRVLQERAFSPLGSSTARASTARVVSATNADVDAMAAAGQFRPDLLYRLNTIVLRLPPLRERREEITSFAEHFAKREAERYGLAVPTFDDEAMAALVAHDWPGNVRELEHAIQRAVLLSAKRARISAADIGLRPHTSGGQTSAPPAHGGSGASIAPNAASPNAPTPPKSEEPRTLREAEREAFARAIERFPNDRMAAAKSLGLSRSAFYRKLTQLGLLRRSQ